MSHNLNILSGDDEGFLAIPRHRDMMHKYMEQRIHDEESHQLYVN